MTQTEKKLSLDSVSIRILEALKTRSRISKPAFTTLTCVKWVLLEKIQTGGLRIYFFEKPLGIFNFFTLPLKICDKTKFNPWIFHKIVLEPLKIPRPKAKTPHYFSVTIIL